MKIVVCEKCGAKYQIEKDEAIDDYECSVCAGSLKKVEEYSLNPTSTSNLNNISYNVQNDSNSHIIYCENCGLKYTLNDNERIEDYECSSCFGNLRYIDEELNKRYDNRMETNINTPINSNYYASKDQNKNNATNIAQLEKKLRTQIKNEFSYKILNSYIIYDKQNLKNEEEKEDKKLENIENEIRKQLEEKNNTSKEKTKTPPKTVREKKDLILHPNIKNTSYHDVYIILGLILILIGLIDIILSQRMFSIIFVAFGLIASFIGIIKKRKHSATETRGRIIREKLMTLPESFYVLYFVKVPSANDGINHVVIGPSGIFTITSQSYSEKENKENLKFPSKNIKSMSKSESEGLKLSDTHNADKVANNEKTIGDEKTNEKATKKIDNNAKPGQNDKDKKKDNENKKGDEKSDIKNTKSKNENKKSKNEDKKSNIKNTKSNDENKKSNDENKKSDGKDKKDNNNDAKKDNEKKQTDKINTKNPEKFKFEGVQTKFDHDNKIKQKAIHLTEELINFLNENGLYVSYVEPLVGFVNNDVAVINMPLTDEDLFLNELLQDIIHGKRQLDDKTTHRVAVLLSQYSTECSS